MPIRLILADDLVLSRTALRVLLENTPEFVVVGEVEQPSQLSAAIHRNQPVVVLMSLSGRAGFSNSTIESLVSENKETPVVVLSTRDESSFARLIVASGAAGFVCLRSTSEELFKAIREVAEGRTYVDSLVASQAGEASLNKMKLGAPVGSHKPSFLSKRETEVLKLLAQGFTNQQVADSLELSVKTAETYRVRLTRKLGMKSRSELFRYAFEIGMIGPDQLMNAE